MTVIEPLYIIHSMNINLILLGATGDLSNKKILPAIGELIFKNPQLAISIYPWSRKDIDLQKLNA